VTPASTPEQKAKARARSRARYAAPGGKEKQATYNSTPKAKATKAAREATPEAKAARAAYSRAKRLRDRYGLTPEQYDLIFDAQGGRCPICRCKPRTRMLAVDHCHRTEKTAGKLASVRGLLCGRCNHQLLGAAHDKVDILRNAIQYLEHPPAPQALLAEEGTL
jgi:hypothetical protein